MNYFFGFKNSYFKCNLTVPKFQNNGFKKKLMLFEAYPKNNFWKINKVNCDSNDNFFFLENNIIENDKVFFLSSNKEPHNFNLKELSQFNSFTKTKPTEYRSNLKIYLDQGGFSSYQSDYPFSMINNLNGSVLSSVSSLLNLSAERNYIIFKNIIKFPLKKQFKAYFIDLIKKKIIKKIFIQSNLANEIEVDNSIINENTFFYSPDLLGIPIYVSVNNKHISMEHTHPPHHYILSADKFLTIKSLKDEAFRIIQE